ncbi:RHS repeat-associated core domain-containing protein [Pseudomonas citrulli]|uniref:RHS repeat-associated core domain-containing protein n=1 Tax=Pseudomonas citrulli TaxID=3064347 RepID=A0ABT9BRU0_9PSED|nr:RHS repeat-associated core domain-containing protein [Pseudomonas sp. K18]MDO7895280.1 RHS repeat-associated core domain-containing protein [Pseudomonas sp. K18]
MAGSNKTEQLAPGETLISFHYDGLDSLTGLGLPGAKEGRFYRNDELVNEIQGPASRTFVRAEGVVLAEHRAGGEATSRLLAGDDKNSVLYELSQGVAAGVAYSPYGHRMEGAMINSHLGYNGERREAHTGWYLLGKGYRAFNPLLMRFHSPDTLSPFGEGGLNAYMYCVGDPINHVDPTGHSIFGFFSRGFRGLIGSNRPTTTTPEGQNLPGVLGLNPHKKNRSTSLLPIRRKDVHRLMDRADLQLERALQVKGDPNKYSEYLMQYDKNFEAYNFARRNLGERLITKYGRAAAKYSSQELANLKKAQANKNKAKFLQWQAEQLQEEKIAAAGRSRDRIRNYLGVDGISKTF